MLRIAVLIAALAMAPTARGAGDATNLSWTHLEVAGGYQHTDAQVSGTLLQASVQLRLSDNYFASARHRQASDARDRHDRTALGVGARFAFASMADLVVSGGAIHQRDRVAASEHADYGAYVATGSRAMVTASLELAGRLEYVEILGDGDASLGADIAWQMLPVLSLVAGAQVSDDERSVHAGLRLTP